MPIRERAGEDKVCEPAKYEERRRLALARVRVVEARLRNSICDPSELADVTTPEKQSVSGRSSGGKHTRGTYVSLTPQMLGRAASSVMRSESRSMPPDAPGTERER